MAMRIFLFIFQCIIFYNIFDRVLTTPMVGEDIRRAEEGEFPPIVSIKRRQNATEKPEDVIICTGTLISPLLVLTAAHCRKSVDLNEAEVIIGSIDIRSGQKRTLSAWVDYNEWASCKKIKVKHAVNDVAVFKLSEAAPTNIKPAAITKLSHKEVYGKFVVTAGWGKTNDGTFSQFLQTTTLKVLSNKDCENKLERTTGFPVPLHYRLFCAVGQRFLLLQFGESGAPILLDNVIVAIQKATAPFPNLEIHPEKVNILTNVAYYKKFLSDVLSSSYRWS